MTTSPITLYPQHRAVRLSRREEMKRLRRAHRIRDRRRRFDQLTYRYRHAMTILAAFGATVIALTVGHLTYPLIVRLIETWVGTR